MEMVTFLKEIFSVSEFSQPRLICREGRRELYMQEKRLKKEYKIKQLQHLLSIYLPLAKPKGEKKKKKKRIQAFTYTCPSLSFSMKRRRDFEFSTLYYSKGRTRFFIFFSYIFFLNARTSFIIYAFRKKEKSVPKAFPACRISPSLSLSSLFKVQICNRDFDFQ